MLALALSGCAGPTSFEVASGFGYRWVGFNHRLAHASFSAGDPTAVAVIGGASTTGVAPALDDGCDADTCKEFPFLDDADVWVEADRVTARGVATATGVLALEVGADGADGELRIAMDRVPKGGLDAWIAGFSLDTRHALSGGDACYDPAFGWMPREIGLSVGAPVAGDGEVRVPVSARFVAGESLEEVRACLDAVNEQAIADVEIEVAVAAGAITSARVPVSHTLAYEYGDGPFDPAPQPAPDLSARPLDVPDGAALGWSSVHFDFHVGDPEGRGGYLRSLSWLATGADGGSASGHADNYSPATQISGFDYAFEGEVVTLVPDRGEVTRVRAAATLPAALDAGGVPILTELPFQ